MRDLLFGVAFVLRIAWPLAMLGLFAAASALHLLLLAAIVLCHQLYAGSSPFTRDRRRLV